MTNQIQEIMMNSAWLLIPGMTWGLLVFIEKFGDIHLVIY